MDYRNEFISQKNSTHFNLPFPTYNKSAADDFENIQAKIWKISIKERIIFLLKRPEYLEAKGDIAFATMHYKSHLLQMAQNASI